MAHMNIQIAPAPSTPLNLKFGIIYAPRVPAPPFAAFMATEAAPDEFVVSAFADDGTTSVMFRGALNEAWRRLALHLRMDAPHHVSD